MKFEEYAKLASRTDANLKNNQLNNAHMVLGILTEVGELADVFKKNMAYKKEIDWINVQEEIGDCLWYVAGLYNHNEYVRDNFKLENSAGRKLWYGNFNLIGDMLAQTSVIFDVIDDQMVEDNLNISLLAYKIKKLVQIIVDFCIFNNFNIENIMQNNIDKLKTRYPEKFTSEKAINRDLTRERQILEELGF